MTGCFILEGSYKDTERTCDIRAAHELYNVWIGNVRLIMGWTIAQTKIKHVDKHVNKVKWGEEQHEYINIANICDAEVCRL